MKQLTIIGLSIFLSIVLLVYLWSIDPLYAFVTGIMILTAALVIIANLYNKADRSKRQPFDHQEAEKFYRHREILDTDKKKSSMPSPAPPPLERTYQEERTDDDLMQEQDRTNIPIPQPQSVASDEEIKAETDVDSEASPRAEAGATTFDITRGGIANFDIMRLVADLDDTQRRAFFERAAAMPPEQQSEGSLLALYREILGAAQPIDQIRFTAYYPRQVTAQETHGFYVYAHIPDALIATDISQFQAVLGGRVPKAQTADTSVSVQEQTKIAVMIECESLQFNQLGSIQAWQAPFVRFDFAFSADDHLIDEVVEGRIAILIGLIEVASLPFSILVTPAKAPIMGYSAQPKPAHVGLKASKTATVYHKIFISYSRKDSAIVEQYRKAQMMMGNTVFMDTYSIRAGENWEEALKQFIHEADIFQLFWSDHARVSDHVQFEWRYALEQHCPDNACQNYIRPTYWQLPIADIPEALKHLHFAYVNLEA